MLKHLKRKHRETRKIIHFFLSSFHLFILRLFDLISRRRFNEKTLVEHSRSRNCAREIHTKWCCQIHFYNIYVAQSRNKRHVLLFFLDSHSLRSQRSNFVLESLTFVSTLHDRNHLVLHLYHHRLQQCLRSRRRRDLNSEMKSAWSTINFCQKFLWTISSQARLKISRRFQSIIVNKFDAKTFSFSILDSLDKARSWSRRLNLIVTNKRSLSISKIELSMLKMTHIVLFSQETWNSQALHLACFWYQVSKRSVDFEIHLHLIWSWNRSKHVLI